MDLTRRDIVKFGAAGVVGAAATAQLPWGAMIGATTASQLAAKDMPRPFRTGFVRPPVLRPDGSRRDKDGVWTDHFILTETARRARILPKLPTLIYGYNGITPGPTIKVRQGRRAVVRVRNQLPKIHPTLGHE